MQTFKIHWRQTEDVSYTGLPKLLSSRPARNEMIAWVGGDVGVPTKHDHYRVDTKKCIDTNQVLHQQKLNFHTPRFVTCRDQPCPWTGLTSSTEQGFVQGPSETAWRVPCWRALYELPPGRHELLSPGWSLGPPLALTTLTGTLTTTYRSPLWSLTGGHHRTYTTDENVVLVSSYTPGDVQVCHLCHPISPKDCCHPYR